MLFVITINTNNTEVIELKSIPHNEEEFFVQHGYPVKPYIHDSYTGEILAYPEQIGMIDNDNQYLQKVDANYLSYIYNERDGNIAIDIEKENEDIIPIVRNGKVKLKLI